MAGGGVSSAEALALADAFEAAFSADILRFWYPRAIDPAGGYRVCWDARGEPTRDERGIISQARLVYVFARAARAGIRRDEMLAAAHHGFEYLRDVMWDHHHGGFVWTLDDSRKVTCGQAFGVFGLAELVLADGSAEAAALAQQAIECLDTNAHDAVHGGYRELFAADWTRIRRGPSPVNPRGADSKLVNSHLHLLEAMVHAQRAGVDERAAARGCELVDVLVRRARRREGVALTDQWSRRWRPRFGDRIVSYGHLIELAWLLLDATTVIPGVDAARVRDEVEHLVARFDAEGVDPVTGGVWRRGDLEGHLTDARFEHWALAEALLGYAWLLREGREPRWWDRIQRLWELVQTRVVDHEVGEWHEGLDPELRPYGVKGSLWKAGYHATRALLDGAQVLREREPSEPAR